MTNCNYSEHTKMQRKEIQKQIEELQAKLEELEAQEPQMTLDKSGNIDVVLYNLKYYYRMGFSSTGRSWLVRNIGDTALYLVQDPETLVKLEQLYEDMILDTGGVEEPEQGTWNYDPDAKFRKQEQVKKLQEKEWTYKITDEKGETNQYKQYFDSVKTIRQELIDYGFQSSAIEDIILIVNRILPKPITETCGMKDWDSAWTIGYNNYRDFLVSKLK